jgi:hypothetical protein
LTPNPLGEFADLGHLASGMRMPREISKKSLPTGSAYDSARDLEALSQEPSSDEIEGE